MTVKTSEENRLSVLAEIDAIREKAERGEIESIIMVTLQTDRTTEVVPYLAANELLVFQSIMAKFIYESSRKLHMKMASVSSDVEKILSQIESSATSQRH